jgi:hypothetical protein
MIAMLGRPASKELYEFADGCNQIEQSEAGHCAAHKAVGQNRV